MLYDSGKTHVELEILEENKIWGLIDRTTNSNEMNSTKAKIAPLWKKFDDAVKVDYRNGNRVYGVYFDYESDWSGKFSILAGTNQINVESSISLESVVLPAGKYLVFSANGGMPQVAIDTWGCIWGYFSKENSEYERLYTTDFELYVYQNEIKIYVAVK